MFCRFCGTQLPDNSAFCPSCGAAQSSVSSTPQPTPVSSEPTYDPSYDPSYKPSYEPSHEPSHEPSYEPSYDAAQFNTPLTNTPAVSSTPILVFGILALSFACTFYLSFLGIIFGAITMSRAKSFLATMGSLSGKAKTGRILGKVGLILGIVLTAILVFVVTLLIIEAVSYDIYDYNYNDNYYYNF